MRLERLRLENFRSHEELDLALGDLDCAVIVGRNGAGKSSILQAVEWAFFGTGSADSLLRYGAHQGGVTVEFEHRGARWKVSRGRERDKKSWLVVAQNGEVVEKHTIADAQRFLVDVLGMDAEAYRASVYAPQGQAGLFAAMGPGQRKELLGDLLGLGHYEEWREKASSDRRLFEENAQNFWRETEIQYQRADDLADAAENESELRDLIARADFDLGHLEGQRTRAIEREKQREQVKQRQEILARMAELKARAARLRERAAKRERIGKQIETAPELSAHLHALEAARQDHIAARARRQVAEQQLQEATHRLAEAHMPDAVCPTCGQALGKASGEAIARLDREVEQIEVTIQSLPSDNGFDEAEYQRVRGEWEAVERFVGEYEGMRNDESIDKLRKEHAELRERAEALPEAGGQGPSPAEVGAQIDELQDRRTELRLRLERSEQGKRERAEALRRAESFEKRARDQSEAMRALTVLEKAFSRRGIPAMILDNAVSAIEQAANDTLDSLGSAMRLRIVTQRKTKAGRYNETLDVLVDDGAFERPLSSYSGGEQYRIHVALRLGFAAMLAAEGGGTPDVLLIDEPTDLDDEGVTMLADVLTRLPLQVILVTHQADLTDAMPQKVVVERASDAASSTVRLG